MPVPTPPLAITVASGLIAILTLSGMAVPVNRPHVVSGVPLVYVADQAGDFVDVFTRNGRLVRRITSGLSGPTGLFVDAHQNLFVANTFANNVLEFPRGAMAPAATFQSAPGAFDATLCPNGALYVTTFTSTILVYARGHSRPTGSLSVPFNGFALSVSCDPAGNVFATATLLSPPGLIVEYQNGTDPGIMLPISIQNPVDAIPDPAGNLLLLNSEPSPYGHVTEYTEAGQFTNKLLQTSGQWFAIAAPPEGHLVFASNSSAQQGELWTFPHNKARQTYIDRAFTRIAGIAYDPGSD